MSSEKCSTFEKVLGTLIGVGLGILTDVVLNPGPKRSKAYDIKRRQRKNSVYKISYRRKSRK